ncbi:MAG TPA: glutathione S-transferase [Hyphomonadaceae bacterium]|nr:glutathione S-transferase [Hyphomonadaceae bacterium]HPI47361.1 glutathione S-transferase [Hyphomonadaceae bacterium]
MAGAKLTISSRNYSSWSLRAWLFCQLAELDVEVESVSIDDPNARAELLLLSPTVLTPRLDHKGASIWDTIAIAEYLEEEFPNKGLLPLDKKPRSHARSIIGEMHGGFYNLRSALPMNLRARYPGFRVFTGAKGDIRRVLTIWNECFEQYDGPFLFGKTPTLADAMYAPVCTRFLTYDVALEGKAAQYRDRILDWAPMKEWFEESKAEPIEIEELDIEF